MVKKEPTSGHIILNFKAHWKGGERPYKKPEEPEVQEGFMCASTQDSEGKWFPTRNSDQ